MSFYINNSNNCRPGAISGNPLTGLCERALIEVTKVFDACRRQTAETGLALPLSNFDPIDPTLPLTFISATASGSAIVSNVIIDRISQRPNFANVSSTITIPVTVSYKDANGVLGTATSDIIVNENVVLFVPQPSVMPINITAFTIFTSTIGTIDTQGIIATVTGCLTIILKVIATVDLLVPSYGYPVIPACHASETNICPGESELPLFPTAIT